VAGSDEHVVVVVARRLPLAADCTQLDETVVAVEEPYMSVAVELNRSVVAAMATSAVVLRRARTVDTVASRRAWGVSTVEVPQTDLVNND
jgi:hypothetical protein